MWQVSYFLSDDYAVSLTTLSVQLHKYAKELYGKMYSSKHCS